MVSATAGSVVTDGTVSGDHRGRGELPAVLQSSVVWGPVEGNGGDGDWVARVASDSARADVVGGQMVISPDIMLQS